MNDMDYANRKGLEILLQNALENVLLNRRFCDISELKNYIQSMLRVAEIGDFEESTNEDMEELDYELLTELTIWDEPFYLDIYYAKTRTEIIITGLEVEMLD